MLPDFLKNRSYRMLSQKGFQRRGRDALFLRNQINNILTLLFVGTFYIFVKLIKRILVRRDDQSEGSGIMRLVRRTESWLEYSALLAVG